MAKNKSFEGVNLGAWLVLERWMTPALFEGTDAQDEYSFMETEIGLKRIEEHRNTFITEDDWKWLAKHNVTHVRLPVGYWALHDDGPYKNVAKHLDWAFAMAEKYNIHILLDLHALKGSQNGEAHSGKFGSVNWRQYEQETLEVVKELALRYRDSPAFWGMEIINEPKVIGNYISLLRYYRDAYKLLSGVLKPGTYTVFQDGFFPLLFSGALLVHKNHPIIMDTHFYGAFQEQLSAWSPKAYDRFRRVLYEGALLLTTWRQPVIVGEWSSVLSREMISRAPNDEEYAMLAATIERQRYMYRRAIGRFYWSYKTEGKGMWNYHSLVEANAINT